MMQNNTMPESKHHPLLEIRNLSVTFRQGEKTMHALNNISLHINKGETLALVGESGSGKTITALSIMKILPPAATVNHNAEIILNTERKTQTNILKQNPKELSDMRGNDIGMIFQEPMTSLNPLHTIKKQITENLLLHQKISHQKAETKTLELLKRVEIQDAEKRLNAYPHQLSGGQRQRIMIAMALANQPNMLIADEPTTALDVTIQARILKLLKQIQKQDTMSLLLITHDLGIVRKMADRIAIMRNGEIVETGNNKHIFENPQHPYTKMLLNAEPESRNDTPDPHAPDIVTIKNLKVYFPLQKGFLRKTVGYIKAVDDISMTLKKGQSYGIVGESGSGKTTLALAILRLISSKGTILWMGKDISQYKNRAMRTLRADMQMVFQDPYGSLSPRMSIGQIIEEGLAIHQPKLNKQERRNLVENTLHDVELDGDIINRYPHEFSGGQRQRIAIARAIITKPVFIVLDEPTSALDMSVQKQIIKLLIQIQKKHAITYLFISHDLKVVKALAAHVTIMQNGRIVEQGSTEHVFNQPKTNYAKNLIAAALNMDVPDMTHQTQNTTKKASPS